MSQTNSIIQNWKSDFDFKTFLSAGFSLVVTLIFAAYNGFLGSPQSINLMDALLAVASMQNALISATKTSPNGAILTLTALSSAFLLITIIAISVRNRIVGMREIKQRT